MKKLAPNKYEMDDGTIVSRQERDFVTYADQSKSVRIPVEAIKNKAGKRGMAVIFGRYLKWSDGSPLSGTDIATVRQKISAAFDTDDYYCDFQV